MVMSLRKNIFIAFAVLAAILFSIAAGEMLFAVTKSGEVDVGTNHALIIGISNYDQWDKLKSPSNDAKEIARILTWKYDFKKENVTLLNDGSKEQPTRIGILTYFENYVNELGEKDNLLIFFSGHSSEDDKGESYWIPKDAKKTTTLTWLRHSDIVREYLASDNFKAKSVCVLTDSMFSKKLLQSKSITLSPFDLRYPEKIREKAQSKSREVISFGDKHWPGDKKSEGHGLFTYYLRKALLDNWFKVIDLENLIFDEDVIFQVSKKAGTRMIRGRLRNTPSEKGGQSVITRTILPPAIDVLEAYASPNKGYVGDRIIIEAQTSSPAYDVYVELGGKKYYMDGEGTEWKHSLKLASLGKATYKIFALNEDEKLGKSKQGEITTLKLLANMVTVTEAAVSPKTGTGGDSFSFTAKTDVSAKRVEVDIEGKRYEMTGSDKGWSLKTNIDNTGTLSYSVIAFNDDGFEGRSKGGILVIKAPVVNIASIKAPDKGFDGDEITITATTDHPASSVSINISGVTYEMEGSDKEWVIKRKISGVGTKKLTVIAKNAEGKEGSSKTGEILTEKRPLGIPDIMTVALSPEKIRAGENFIVKIKTSTDADKVFIELDGKKLTMDGSGTDWKYSTQIPGVGATDYKILALNKNGEQGQAKAGKITTIEKAPKGANIASLEVSPKQGNLGQTFTFNAKTSIDAQSATLVIGEKRYKMTGSGTSWTLKRKIDDLGTIDFYVIASDKEGIEGSSSGGTLQTKALLANIVNVKASSEKGFAGEEFLITADTDNPAASVTLEMDGVTYEMEGSGKKWTFKRTIPEPGKKTFTVTANNIEESPGKTKTGELLAKLAIPDVASIDLNPKEIFAGDSFVIKVQTSSQADKVFVEIGKEKFTMEGSGTEWRYMTQVASIGATEYKVTAQNKEGTAGQAKQGEIKTTKKPGALINIAKAEVEPAKGFAGQEFTFKALTDNDAVGVTLTIGGKSYKMTGSGKDWSFSQKIDKTGNLAYSIAALNEDQIEGSAQTAQLTVEKITKRYAKNADGTITDRITNEVKNRFVDNGNQTVTDLFLNLVWLQEPKRLPLSWDEADTYARSLEFQGQTGWRLPTATELNNLIDKTQKAPALPQGHPFKNVIASMLFWSKTPHKTLASRVYVAELYNGKIINQNKKDPGIAWAVRYIE